MIFQSEVKGLAVGIPGTIAKNVNSYLEGSTGVVSGNNVCLGCFVQTKQNGNEGEVTGASGVAITGKILGVVIRDGFINSCGLVNSHIYPENTIVTYITRGSVWIENDSQACKKGQYVFLKDADGKIAFDDNITKADHTFTGFRVLEGHADNTDGVISITTAL